jgi:hypothetical protein
MSTLPPGSRTIRLFATRKPARRPCGRQAAGKGKGHEPARDDTGRLSARQGGTGERLGWGLASAGRPGPADLPWAEGVCRASWNRLDCGPISTVTRSGCAWERVIARPVAARSIAGHSASLVPRTLPRRRRRRRSGGSRPRVASFYRGAACASQCGPALLAADVLRFPRSRISCAAVCSFGGSSMLDCATGLTRALHRTTRAQ